MISKQQIIEFELPTGLTCPHPSEMRNISRDEVQLLVTKGSGEIEQGVFKNIAIHLDPGDVLVVNTSAMLATSFPIKFPDSVAGVVNFSTYINDRGWLAEIRQKSENKSSGGIGATRVCYSNFPGMPASG